MTGEQETWQLYSREAKGTPEWLSLKLCAKGRVYNKANYWFGYNPDARRFARARDLVLLEQGRPELMQEVEALLRRVLGCAA